MHFNLPASDTPALESGCVLTEKRDALFIVTINRPEVRNAIDASTAEALAVAFRAFDEDDSLFVAILTGAGSTFCSGADLKSLADDMHAPRLTHPNGCHII